MQILNLRPNDSPVRDSARSVHLTYNAGKQALARTCNLDYSEGLPINCVDRKAFFFARSVSLGSSLGSALNRPTSVSCHPLTARLSSRGLEFCQLDERSTTCRILSSEAIG
jgi:hypothetical protein